MSSLSLRSDGAIAKYLGFCTAQPYMHPRSFCTLFWWMLLGPLAIIPCWIFRGIQELEIKWHKHKTEQHEREVKALIALYRAKPYEAFIDFVEHFDSRIASKDRKRSSWKIVDNAFLQLRKEYNVSLFAQEQILCHLGAVPSQSDTECIDWDIYRKMKEEYFTTRVNNPPKNVPSWVTFWLPRIPFIGVPILPFILIEIFLDNAFLGMAPIAVSVLLSIFLCSRLELDTVLYQCYRAIKDRTCPIIKWEEPV